ncbi:GNAT family N-acetyltransferase [Dinoroseobacter sp. PD6]|uniref:GNAT family N-acetyltransferase n=1 Tax=Dinoroseobacter sp. PD6 TaxID=3028384 RepID=UPI00237BAA4F|nr:GNAT family N-acetyltransferase [Dinoroseobacter sp. PD6]MDD9718895.1 GNAT family N-acetyltransferase [Dinoroseobacter sp. PD6]
MRDTDLHIPTLTTERLILRPLGLEDVDALVPFYATEGVRFVGGPMTREQVWRMVAMELGHWQLRGYGRWAVARRDTGVFCGTVGLWCPEGWPEPEIGWTLLPAAQGQGIATEAARTARHYAYDVLDWDTAISLIDPANARSIALAERLGARHDGMYTHERFGPMAIWRHPSAQELAT